MNRNPGEGGTGGVTGAIDAGGAGFLWHEVVMRAAWFPLGQEHASRPLYWLCWAVQKGQAARLFGVHSTRSPEKCLTRIVRGDFSTTTRSSRSTRLLWHGDPKHHSCGVSTAIPGSSVNIFLMCIQDHIPYRRAPVCPIRETP